MSDVPDLEERWRPDPALSEHEKLRAINGRFRRVLGDPRAGHIPGRAVVSNVFAALDPRDQIEIFARVSGFPFDSPDADLDHARGVFSINGLRKLVWHIAVFSDERCEYGAEDPTDLENSFRILTICFRDEE